MKQTQSLFLVTATIILSAALLSGCAGPRMNISRSTIALSHPVKTVALMPSGGVLADAIGIELLNFGLDVVDTATVTSIMARFNLTEVELAHPQNIRKLADEGIDTILLVKSVSGYLYCLISFSFFNP